MSRFEAWAVKDIRRRRIDVSMAFVDGTQVMAAQPTVFSGIDEDAVLPTALSLSAEQATELMDALWKEGVRPTGVGSPGELGATKYHLEDMRKLVFGEKEKANGSGS